ncbi:FCD domain-containing protein [Streptomyces tauricus]|uniref:FCD domain-containing protein n=1 Tax=Streptomyces tauricus TaxID=68274 RepID=UPI00387F0326
MAVPAATPGRLAALLEAVELLEEHASLSQEDTAAEDTHRFHRALVALSGHRRLEESYRAISLQLLVYMTMNRRARAATETLTQRAARHRGILDLVLTGVVEETLAALRVAELHPAHRLRQRTPKEGLRPAQAGRCFQRAASRYAL